MWGAAHPLVASPRASPARLRRTTSLREVAGKELSAPVVRQHDSCEADAGEARRRRRRGGAQPEHSSHLASEAMRRPPRGSQPHPPGPPPHEWGGGNVSRSGLQVVDDSPPRTASRSAEYVFVAHAQDAPSESGKRAIALFIHVASRVVNCAVHLDDQTSRDAEEVDDEPADDHLPSEPYAESATTKLLPQERLRVGRSHASPSDDRFDSLRPVAHVPPAPLVGRGARGVGLRAARGGT